MANPTYSPGEHVLILAFAPTVGPDRLGRVLSIEAPGLYRVVLDDDPQHALWLPASDLKPIPKDV